MTVRELISLLEKYPQDALVVTDFCSDLDEIEEEHISLWEPKDGEGVINHHGHLMWLEKKWWPKHTKDENGRTIVNEPRPTDPKLLTCVHFRGN